VLTALLRSPSPGVLRLALLGCASLVATWGLAQYALCLPWIQDLLLHLSPDALEAAAWAGLVVPPSGDPAIGGAALERLLRLKCLILVAVALRLRACRWV